MIKLLQAFEQALRSLDRVEAQEILGEASQKFTITEISEQLIMPALEQIGEDWQAGDLSLSQVYMSGRICEELVDGLTSAAPESTLKHPLAAIAVLDDYHLLGKRIVISMLSAMGYTLIDYGRVTVDELVTKIENDKIEILLISVLMLNSALQVKPLREQLKKAGRDVKIIVGGAPFNFDRTLWQEVGADAMGKNAKEAADFIKRFSKKDQPSKSNPGMTSIERVTTALQHKEPDRVPFFLSVTMHGAKELDLPLKEYFSKAENVAEGQQRLLAKYRDDFVINFFYSSFEIEAWGGETIFKDDGPPNAGEPIIRKPEEIKQLEVPDVNRNPSLIKSLRATELLKEKLGDQVPVLGAVISPFSLPVMQMGFENYIELIHNHPDLFKHLMSLNEEFCVEWANAQLAAGATAIGYFDPVSSPTVIPRDLYLQTGFMIAQRTLKRIKGPAVVHLASGRCLPIIDDIVQTGAAIIGASVLEDLKEVKKACQGKVTVLGNLNGIEMRRWSTEQAEAEVKACIAKAGPSGGFILADNHGEIPWQVPDDVLMAISDAVHKWGRYPLSWIENEEI